MTWKRQDISQQLVIERFSRVLPRYIGPGTEYPISLVVESIGAHRNTVDNWYHGRGAPDLCMFYRLCSLLGSAFVNEVLAEPIGMTGVRDMTPDEMNTHAQLNAKIAAQSADWCKALSDGHLDHREKQQLVAGARGLINDLETFIAIEGEQQG